VRGRGRPVAAVVAGLVLVAIAFGAPDDDAGGALDPRGTGPDGAAGLVLVLEELGADVEIVRGSPPADAATAVVLDGALADGDVADTLAWVRAGGVLLVADPRSALADGAADGPCPAALRDVGELHLRDDDVVRRDEGPEGTCFDGEVRVADVGAGAVIALDTPAPLVNELLDEADDAVLAAAVLAPTPGTAVAFVAGPSIGADSSGDETLGELVDPDVRRGLVQAAIAALLWVAWRARRLGRPVVEDQPVRIAGSELVVAVGRLLDGRDRPDEAAAVLRAEVRRVVGSRLGLAADAAVRTVAAAVAPRSTLDVDRVAAALAERPVTTDEDLLAVSADLDQIRSDVVGSQTLVRPD
jgi:hypothetical protein